jgi:hypothetical protein
MLDPNDMSEEEQIEYVKIYYDNIQDIENPNEKVCLWLLKKEARAF